MRWPWSRHEPAGIPAQAVDPAPPPPTVERPTAAWAALPTLQRTMPTPVLTTAPVAFVTGLAAWRGTGLITPIQRQVDPVLARVGPDPDEWGIGAPRLAAGAVPMPVGPGRPSRPQSPVQRQVAGPASRSAMVSNAVASASPQPAGRSGLTSARDSGLPVVQLTAEPLPPELALPSIPEPPDSPATTEPVESTPPADASVESTPANPPSVESTHPVDQPVESTPAKAPSMESANIDASAADPPPAAPETSTAAIRAEAPAALAPLAALPILPSSRLLPVQRSADPTEHPSRPGPPASPPSAAPGVAAAPESELQRDVAEPPPETAGPPPETAVAAAPRPSRPRLGLGEPLPSTPSAEEPRAATTPPTGDAVATVAIGGVVRPEPAAPTAAQRMAVVQRMETGPTSGSGPTGPSPSATTVEIPWLGPGTASSAQQSALPNDDPQTQEGETPDLVMAADPVAPSEPDAPAEAQDWDEPLPRETTAADPPQDPAALNLPVVQRHDSPSATTSESSTESTDASPEDERVAPAATDAAALPAHESSTTSSDDPEPTPTARVDAWPGDAAAPVGGVPDGGVLPVASGDLAWGETASASRSATPADPRAASLADLKVVPVQRLLDTVAPAVPHGPVLAPALPAGLRRASPALAVVTAPTGSTSWSAQRAVGSEPAAWAAPGQRAPGGRTQAAHQGTLQTMLIGSHRATPWAASAQPQTPHPAPMIEMPLGRPSPPAFGSMVESEAPAEAAASELPELPAETDQTNAVALQRYSTGAESPDGQASPGGPSPTQHRTAAGAAGSAPSATQVDELARQLFDPLMLRLRAELLVERERRGLRTDAW